MSRNPVGNMVGVGNTIEVGNTTGVGNMIVVVRSCGAGTRNNSHLHRSQTQCPRPRATSTPTQPASMNPSVRLQQRKTTSVELVGWGNIHQYERVLRSLVSDSVAAFGDTRAIGLDRRPCPGSG